MARIKNFGTATMKFGEGIIVSGSAGSDDYALVVTGSSIILDALHVSQYIRHADDSDTHLNFTDNKINSKVGNITMLTMEKSNVAPHEITFNDGGNNIDFIVKGNGSNEGNPGFKFDASTNRVGINGVGTPTVELDVDGDIKASGDLYADKIRRSSDSDTTTKILLNDELIKLYAGHSSNNILAVGNTNTEGTDNNFWVSGSIGSKGTATQGIAVFGGDLVVSGTLTAIQKHICTAKYTATNNNQQYIRFNAASSNTSPGSNNKFIAPCAGRLSYIIIRSTGTPGQTEVAFHRSTNGTANLATTPLETIDVTMSNANTAYQVYFTPVANFGPGDIVGLSVNPVSNHGNVDITLVFELDFVI